MCCGWDSPIRPFSTHQCSAVPSGETLAGVCPASYQRGQRRQSRVPQGTSQDCEQHTGLSHAAEWSRVTLRARRRCSLRGARRRGGTALGTALGTWGKPRSSADSPPGVMKEVGTSLAPPPRAGQDEGLSHRRVWPPNSSRLLLGSTMAALAGGRGDHCRLGEIRRTHRTQQSATPAGVQHTRAAGRLPPHASACRAAPQENATSFTHAKTIQAPEPGGARSGAGAAWRAPWACCCMRCWGLPALSCGTIVYKSAS